VGEQGRTGRRVRVVQWTPLASDRKWCRTVNLLKKEGNRGEKKKIRRKERNWGGGRKRKRKERKSNHVFVKWRSYIQEALLVSFVGLWMPSDCKLGVDPPISLAPVRLCERDGPTDRITDEPMAVWTHGLALLYICKWKCNKDTCFDVAMDIIPYSDKQMNAIVKSVAVLSLKNFKYWSKSYPVSHSCRLALMTKRVTSFW